MLEYKALEKKYNDLLDCMTLANAQTYGSSKSQKGIDKKKSVKGKHDDKDDFDDTLTSLASQQPTAVESEMKSKSSEAASEERPYRKGLIYNKSVVGVSIMHKSDYSLLLKGLVVISSSYKKIRNIVSHIEEHHFEVLKVKHADGIIERMYLPMKDDVQACLYDKVIPGTHITVNLLSYLIFKRYQMATPAHRAAKGRLADMDWSTSVQNLLNWADKGAVQLNLLIPALKKVALQNGTNVHVDETWLRYQTYDEKRKTYMWCLVNRKARIVIFFYEDAVAKNGEKLH